MMMALAGIGATCPACSCPAASRCRPRDGEDAGKIQSIGARYAHGELTLAGGGRARLPGLRQPRRRLPVPRHGRHRRRSSPRRSACRCRTRRWPPRASRSGSTWPGARPGRWSRWRAQGLTTRDILTDAVDPQRDGRPRGVRRLDEPAAAHPGHRLRRRPAAGRRSTTGTTINVQVPRLVERPAQRPGLPSDRPRLPRRRRARSDAPPARARPARRDGADRRPASRSARVLDWWADERAPRRGSASGCSSRTASIPTT